MIFVLLEFMLTPGFLPTQYLVTKLMYFFADQDTGNNNQQHENAWRTSIAKASTNTSSTHA
jgi:hypothetical protein